MAETTAASGDCKVRPLLLLVYPGAAGRLLTLKRLLVAFDVCVLVTQEDLVRSAWAQSLLGKDRWIECGDAAEGVLAAIQAWRDVDSPTRSISGVMCYDDFGLELCAQIGEHLGLAGTPLAQVKALKNKFLFRERCHEVGIPVPRYAILRDDADLQALLQEEATWRFPCVLKPVAGAGSWHVTKLESAEALRVGFADFWQQLNSGSLPRSTRDAGFLLEEYFAGHEVDVDGWARQGEVEFCTVSDNRPAIEPHFLETGGVYPSQLPSQAIEVLKDITNRVVRAFPGMHGAFHFEAKIDVESLAVMPIECNARVGGAECPVSVEAVTGYFLPEVLAQLALNLPSVPAAPRHAVVASINLHHHKSGILAECSSESLDAEACKMVHFELFGVKGKRHEPNMGSRSCLGWAAVGGCSAEEAEANLQKAVSQLRISVVPAEEYQG